MISDAVIAYIDMIEPDHSRTGCIDRESHNAAFNIDGQVYNTCNRCTLIHIAEIAMQEDLAAYAGLAGEAAQ